MQCGMGIYRIPDKQTSKRLCHSLPYPGGRGLSGAMGMNGRLQHGRSAGVFPLEGCHHHGAAARPPSAVQDLLTVYTIIHLSIQRCFTPQGSHDHAAMCFYKSANLARSNPRAAVSHSTVQRVANTARRGMPFLLVRRDSHPTPCRQSLSQAQPPPPDRGRPP